MRAVTLVAFAAAWIVAAVLLYHTSVPPLHLSGLDEHRYFTAHELQRAHTYATGERVIWLLRTVATIVALVVLVVRVPRDVEGIGLGRIGTAIVEPLSVSGRHCCFNQGIALW